MNPDFSKKKRRVRHRAERAVLVMSKEQLIALQRTSKKREQSDFKKYMAALKADHKAAHAWSRSWGQWWAICRLAEAAKKGGAA